MGVCLVANTLATPFRWDWKHLKLIQAVNAGQTSEERGPWLFAVCWDYTTQLYIEIMINLFVRIPVNQIRISWNLLRVFILKVVQMTAPYINKPSLSTPSVYISFLLLMSWTFLTMACQPPSVFWFSNKKQASLQDKPSKRSFSLRVKSAHPGDSKWPFLSQLEVT